MLLVLKESRLEKINPSMFNVIRISAKDDFRFMMPPATLLKDFQEKNVSKKKFEKKYIEYISRKNTTIEQTIYSIASYLKDGNNICLVCTDDEYEIGYLKILANYIANLFGFEASKLEDYKSAYEDASDSLSKKERKLLKTPSDEVEDLGKKDMKLYKSASETVAEYFKTEFSDEGEELLNTLSKRYAVESLVTKLIQKGDVSLNKDGAVESIDVSKKKARKCIEAIIVATEDKKTRSVIKNVMDSHDIPLKAKKLRKLGTNEIVTLIIEIYTALCKFRQDRIFPEDND